MVPENLLRGFQIEYIQVEDVEPRLTARYAKHAAAKRAVQSMLQQGEDSDSMRQLVQTALNEIYAAVNASQAGLDNLANGSKCNSVGQSEIVAERKALVNATNQSELLGSFSKLWHTKLKVGVKKFSVLRTSKCSFMRQEAEFIAVDESIAERSNENEAGSIFKAARQALVTAQETSAEEQNSCRCTIKQDHAAAWNDAISASSTISDAWENANHGFQTLPKQKRSDHVVQIPRIGPNVGGTRQRVENNF